MSQLTGKIYWIEDDLKYIGVREPKSGETSHTVAIIENIIIDENMTRFIAHPAKEDYPSYTVNLTVNQRGTGYEGRFTSDSDSDWNGEVFCEAFSNKGKYFLYGKWIEEDIYYTWWAIIDRENK